MGTKSVIVKDQNGRDVTCIGLSDESVSRIIVWDISIRVPFTDLYGNQTFFFHSPDGKTMRPIVAPHRDAAWARFCETDHFRLLLAREEGFSFTISVFNAHGEPLENKGGEIEATPTIYDRRYLT